jgi:hypothetical protein
MEHLWGIPLTLVYLALLILLVRKWNHFAHESLSKNLVTLFLIYKVLLGLSLSLIYIYYYQVHEEADIFKYFDDSYHMTRALWEKPGDFFKMISGIGNDTDYFTTEYYSKMNHWFRMYETQVYNDNHTMIRINAAMRLLSFGYFHIHELFFSFISFFGIMSFFKGFALFTNENKHKILAFALFLFPSLNFWSAGALKESIMIFALGNIFYVTCLLVKRKSHYRHIILAAVSITLALFLKTYTLIALGVGLTGLILCFLAGNRYIALVYSGLVLFGVINLGVFDHMYSDYDLPGLITQKHDDFIRLSLYTKAGSTFNIGDFEPTWGDLLKKVPRAFYTGLFQPTFLDVRNPIMLLSALESFVIMFSLILAIAFFQKQNREQVNMILCCTVVIVILCTIIGLTTANFGSLVRYKVAVLPFIIFICVSLINFKKIGNHELKETQKN